MVTEVSPAGRSGRPSPSTRTISKEFQAATPAISSDLVGSFRPGKTQVELSLAPQSSQRLIQKENALTRCHRSISVHYASAGGRDRIQGHLSRSRSNRTHRRGNDKGDHRLVAAPWHSQAALRLDRLGAAKIANARKEITIRKKNGKWNDKCRPQSSASAHRATLSYCVQQNPKPARARRTDAMSAHGQKQTRPQCPFWVMSRHNCPASYSL